MADFGGANAILHGGDGPITALVFKVVVGDRLDGRAVVVASEVGSGAKVAGVGGNRGERGSQDGANSERELHDDAR